MNDPRWIPAGARMRPGRAASCGDGPARSSRQDAGHVRPVRTRTAGAALAAAGLLLLGALPATAQQAVTNPHGALPQGLDCAACHTAKNWHTLRAPLGFDHDRTSFRLTGTHARAACAQCHLDLRFDRPAIASSDCAGCHMDIHEGRMLQGCAQCHNTRSFRDVDGELIHARTHFPLTGAHRQITCESCHSSDVGGSFTALPTTCVACHQADFRGAKTVDHVANSYPTDCTQCHTTLSWHDSPAFDHAQVANGFALQGAHAELRCASCHQVPGMQPLFSPTSQDDCIACHQADFNREHSGSSFPTTCLSCHNQNRWGGVSFDHNATSFPLVGAHASLSCQTCHGPDNLAGRPANANDCVACHQPQYDQAHGGTGMPTDCASCHTSTAWQPSTFDHDAQYFAIYSGAHNGVWSTCQTCHTTPGDYSAFTCLECHEHNKTDTDSHHSGVSGYVYDSAACYSCHRRGGGG